jgi:hypothetical protein
MVDDSPARFDSRNVRGFDPRFDPRFQPGYGAVSESPPAVTPSGSGSAVPGSARPVSARPVSSPVPTEASPVRPSSGPGSSAAPAASAAPAPEPPVSAAPVPPARVSAPVPSPSGAHQGDVSAPPGCRDPRSGAVPAVQDDPASGRSWLREVASRDRSSTLRNPFVVALVIAGIVLVVAGGGLYLNAYFGFDESGFVTQGQYMAVEAYLRVGPQVLLLGVATLVGVGFMLALRWQPPSESDDSARSGLRDDREPRGQ